MTETTARTYHTMESLRQMAQTDLRNVNRKELVDINEVEIRKDLSQRERMVDFISQIKNPYCYETEDTLNTQILQIHNYIKEHPELTLTDTYVDNGFTGTNFDRPEFERMMQCR